MDISESKDFPVHTKSLREVRDFAREIFDQSPIFNNQKDELVLAIAEAAQNIVKHAYKDISNTKDIMQIKISFKDNELKIGFYDKGKPVNQENIKHRKLDDIKPGGLGTFFIQQIMDEVVFKEATGWHNHLVLTKNFNHQQ
ncbi:MAG: ATP-binding protein [Candidatus Pelagibacter sp.]|tara:strand:- start:464 stop:886 length:423 start_codon:yes stop_codon:yes gene_type:complete